MNIYYLFSFIIFLVFMIEDWNYVNQYNIKVIVGFIIKNGGVSNFLYELLNIGLYVWDEVYDVVKNCEVIVFLCGIDLDFWVFVDQIYENCV